MTIQPALQRMCKSRTRSWHRSVYARRAAAVTILELLIVMTSITSLTSLFLPAVLASREAGRDQQCANQLRRISVGLHAYDQIHGTLPAGWTLDATKSSGHGWAAKILPQLDEESLSDQIDTRRPIQQVSASVRSQTPAIYLCPSDHGGRDFPLFAELGAPGANAQQSTKMLVTLPRANYMGVFGVIEPDEVAGDSGEGVFVEGRGFRYDEIKRGLSHVALLGERTTRKLPSTWLGIAMAGEDAGGRIVGCANEGPNRAGTDECEFDSRHYGHVNFAWVDGHVSSVQNDIDPHVYQQFAKRR
jgi:prepilin-type processing-associated H-X9-DG protein